LVAFPFDLKKDYARIPLLVKTKKSGGQSGVLVKALKRKYDAFASISISI
jgi:hypothetical protein